MFKLSMYLPFSISTLKKYSDKVNWISISKNYYYYKTFDFINNFYDKISWENIDRLDHLSYINIEQLVFIDKYIPVKIAITKRILELDHIKKYTNIIAPYCNEFITIYKYNVDLLEELDETIISPHLINYAEQYTNKCIDHGFLSRKYAHIIKSTINNKSNDWSKFIIRCKPDETFLLNFVIDDNTNKETWNAISNTCILSNKFIEDYSDKLNWNILVEQNKVDMPLITENHIKNLNEITISKFNKKLTPEFIEMCIEKYPDKLDWYYLCEYQDLPEDLMIKNIDKLNWGQVSLYQKLSKEFIQKYSNRINHDKLMKNINYKLAFLV
jgi:hypothetical protein